jgi:hypothetical protein
VIGRGMKVNHEELIGALVAIEIAMKEGDDNIQARSIARLERIKAEVSKSGLEITLFDPPVSYKAPHLRIIWDEKRSNLSADRAREKLQESEPRIFTRHRPDPIIGIELTGWMLDDFDEAELIRRLKQLFSHVI